MKSTLMVPRLKPTLYAGSREFASLVPQRTAAAPEIKHALPLSQSPARAGAALLDARRLEPCAVITLALRCDGGGATRSEIACG